VGLPKVNFKQPSGYQAEFTEVCRQRPLASEGKVVGWMEPTRSFVVDIPNPEKSPSSNN
jgi:hypothetical protein